MRGYRIHPQGIPGKPDLAFTGRRVAVFVDGCFWHACRKCYVQPKSNTGYWITKIAANRKRDLRVNRKLRRQGWTVLRFWEHEVERDATGCAHRVAEALSSR
jgi:DNA mismatch endonuclease (patch repair protein)